MCRPASFVVTKNRVLWLPDSDNPSTILTYFGVPDLDETPEFVKVEIAPLEGLYNAPLSEWVFRVDQDRFPEWWSVEWGEKVCRAELKLWLKAHTITENVDEISEGAIRFVYKGSPKIGVNKGTLYTYRGSKPVIEENTGDVCTYGDSQPVIEKNTGYFYYC